MRLFSHKVGSLSTVLGIVLISVLLAACGNGNAGAGNTGNGTPAASGGSSTTAKAKNCTKVGVLLPETSTSPRWETYDKVYLEQDIKQISGVSIDYYNAQGDPNTQLNQADQALTKGDCILVVAPNDGTSAAAIVTKAQAQGVPVIAYDRMIQAKTLNYYVSYDGVAVGNVQGQYILSHYKQYGSGKNVIMIDGSSDDPNALQFHQGAINALQPSYTNGTLKKLYDQFTPKWDAGTARNEFDQALTANQSKVQVAYVANDTMANSVIASLRAKKLNGKVLVTGQDATVIGLQNILKGDQAMTVYKSFSQEAQAAANIVKALHDGTDPSSTTNFTTTKNTAGGSIPGIVLPPVAVDKTNMKKYIFDTGYLSKSTVCAGIPAGTDGVC
ncbi:MAG TPA: substrate-binding domain-containing protein [Ktedonobacteraceae bacterium]|jgi:D-xylose transport system substrate-binding protein|nr:substrate-binding domain-containing protein [Ktedonobacteraceae bacterium]